MYCPAGEVAEVGHEAGRRQAVSCQDELGGVAMTMDAGTLMPLRQARQMMGGIKGELLANSVHGCLDSNYDRR
jgi:hypothetical protein